MPRRPLNQAEKRDWLRLSCTENVGPITFRQLLGRFGAAQGIDTAVHQASLATGSVAILAGGVSVVYPQENRALFDQLIERGCILSDMPLGCELLAKLFRAIAGLSQG
jgi:predicted Rossmann fold nucleotide-binding protein DprA/Smf involved in DNA uptake